MFNNDRRAPVIFTKGEHIPEKQLSAIISWCDQQPSIGSKAGNDEVVYAFDAMRAFAPAGARGQAHFGQGLEGASCFF